ncbi:GNAT family N-acetyltransferase [Candidatus Bathyarchaeota archaeon]|nr:GNAT family N-acetyltransferase [Candidatus Bathyarchaeota archaeon]
MPNTTIRAFEPSDEPEFLETQRVAFRGLEYLPRVKVGLLALDHEGSFVAERDGSVIGCVGLFKLERPGWFEVRNLAVKDLHPEKLAVDLLAKTSDYLDSKRPEFVKASTPAVQPYVDLYKRTGFVPARRSVRIRWDLSTCKISESKVETRNLLKEHANDAAEVWVEGLRPHWDYWIEEQGGPDELKAWVKQSVGKDTGWIGAFFENKLVGVAILRADSYGKGEARFNGAYALPDYRQQGIGTALMNASIREARQFLQDRMRVYTLAYLDHLAPGAILYLKSGGLIEAEYLQLEKKGNKS